MGRGLVLRTGAIVLVCAFSFSACATVPLGPSVMALPGTGKPFEQFQFDDVTCRQWASQQTRTSPEQALVQARPGAPPLVPFSGPGWGPPSVPPRATPALAPR